jgi:predicted RNase H-like HicB family nuclease
MKEYIAFFEYENENTAIGVVFPDLEGCFSAGDDFDDAFRNAHEALSLYADGNEEMPEPRTLEKIKEEWADWAEWENNYKFYIGKVALYPLRFKTRKFNVSIDERLVRRIDRITTNRSAFIVEAIEQLLEG